LADRITSYLESVESKLRETELARASESARAEEERKRRRVTMALAASLLLLVTLGASGWIYFSAERAARQAIVLTKVNEFEEGLLRVGLLQQERKWDTAAVQLEQLQNLADELGEDRFAIESRNAACDLEMARTIDEHPVQLYRTLGSRPYLEIKGRDGQIANLLRRYLQRRFQIDSHPLELNDDQTATIARTPVRLQLIAMLDDWATALSPSTGRLQEEILTLASHLDTSDIGHRIRSAVIQRDQDAMAKIAANLDPMTVDPYLLKLLGESIVEKDTSRKLLSQLTLLYPRVFYNWIRAASASGRRLEFYRGAVAAYTDVPELWINLSTSLVSAGLTEEAEETLRTGIFRFPHSGAIRSQLATLCFQSNRIPQAQDLLKQAIELEPEYYPAHLLAGQIAESQDELEEADASFRKAIRCGDGQQSPIKAYLSFLKRHERASEIDAIPNWITEEEYLSPYGLYLCGRALYLAKHEGVAKQLLQTSLERDENNASAMHYLGLCLEREQDLEGARQTYVRQIELGTPTASAYSSLAGVLAAQGKTEEAIATYEKLTELNPNSATTFRNVGKFFEKQKIWGKAATAYRRAIEIDPTSARHRDLGNLLKKQGKIDEAISEYRIAIEIDPKYAFGYIFLGDALRSKGDIIEAIAEYQSAIKYDPRNKWGHINLGNAWQSQGKTAEAAAAFKAAIAIDPQDRNAHNTLAWLWATTPDQDGHFPNAAEAVTHAQEAVRLAPKDAGIVNTLGVALYRANNWAEAITALQKSIEMGSDNAHNWLFLAMSHWQLDNKPEATKWYKKSKTWRDANPENIAENTELQTFFNEAETLFVDPGE